MPQYGGFWRRFAAYIIDAIILNIAFSIVFSVFGAGSLYTAGLGGEPSEAMATGLGLGLMSVSIIGSWAYYALMESSSMQATLGKKALGMIVTDLEGRRVSLGKATGRFFGKILSGMILGIGYIMIGFTERKQGLHDMLAGTLVYKAGSSDEIVSDAGVFS
jgi:uncharacterized RDD family membrane protein YckC